MSSRIPEISLALFLAILATGCTGQWSDGQNPDAELGGELFAGNDDAFDLALAGLLSPDAEHRARAFRVFQNHWSDATDHVARLTGNEAVPKRMAGAYLMAQLGNESELPVLRQFLEDPAPKVRLQAMPGIVRLKDRESIVLLLELVPEAEYETLLVILDTLFALDPGIAERECRKLAEDEGWARRRAAAQLLARLGTETSIDVLVSLLGDPVWLVQADAADSVGQRRLRSQREELKELLGHGEWQVRAAAAKAIANIGEPDDVIVVAGVAVGDGTRNVRQAAAGALSAFSGELVLETIEGIISAPGEHHKVKRAAFESLAKIGGDRARAMFEKALRSDNEELSRQARVVLETADSDWIGLR